MDETLTLFFPIFPFDPRENIRKPWIFWCFQRYQNGKLGRKGLSYPYLGEMADQGKRNKPSFQPLFKDPNIAIFRLAAWMIRIYELRSPTFAECNIFCPFLSFVALAGNDFQLICLTHFSPVLRFIQKQVIRFRLQSKWLVSLWNTTLDWNNLNYFLIFWILLPATKKHYEVGQQ